MNDSSRSQWLEERRTGIGASDAPVVLGASQWKTPYDLWREKRGTLPQTPDSWLMRWGRAMEPELRQYYSDTTGREVMMVPGLVRHPKRAWQFFTPDGFTKDRRVLQIKVSRSGDGWGEPGSDDIPQPIIIQVQHELMVSEYRLADVLLGVYGQEPTLYTVEADPEIHDILTEAEGLFWERVTLGVPPEPANFADVVSRYGKHSRAGSVVADNHVLAAVSELRDLKHVIDQGGERVEALKMIVMKALGEHDTLIDVDGKILVTWKEAKPAKRFDALTFALEYPQLFSQFRKEGEPNRRFLLKG